MRFLVLATPRTGSTLMVDALAPFCHHEIWHPARRARAPEDYPDPDEQPYEYLDAWCRDNPPKSGAKVMLDALATVKVADLMRDIDATVLLRRRNVTEQVVSFALAQHTRAFDWRTRLDDDWRVEPVEIPLQRLLGLAETWLWQTVAAMRSPWPKLRTLWYEDLDTPTLKRARGFLGLQSVERIETQLRVQRSEERYRRLVLNYDAINEAMGDRFGVLFGKPGRCWDE